MLRIKADRMNELEKFEFIEYAFLLYWRRYLKNNRYLCVHKVTREIITTGNCIYRTITKNSRYIQDLIQADMVEEVME